MAKDPVYVKESKGHMVRLHKCTRWCDHDPILFTIDQMADLWDEAYELGSSDYITTTARPNPYRI